MGCRHNPLSCKPRRLDRVDVAVAGIMDALMLVLETDQIRKDAHNGRLSVEQFPRIIEKQQQNINPDYSRDLTRRASAVV
jgi:hypothetical protein